MKRVSDLLDQQATTLWHVRPDDTVYDALRLLVHHGAGALTVMDGARLAGIVSERDHTAKVALEGRDPKQTQVRDIMTRSVLVVAPDTSSQDCLALMSEKRIHHLPVVDRGTVLGMISLRDIADDIIADHEVTISQLETYIHA
jgi:CBS domain-containing protein